MAAAFAGRAKAYEQAFLDEETVFFEVLARNLLAHPLDEGQRRFWSGYLGACVTHLDGLDLAAVTSAQSLFPPPVACGSACPQARETIDE